MTTHLKLKNTGSNPYVFFSACKSNELAKEKARQGCFTRALLALLKDLGPAVISESCSQVIKSLQEKIEGSVISISSALPARLTVYSRQSPQCEGLNSAKRPIFQNYRSPYMNFFYHLTLTGEILTLKGGIAHGFCEGDQLAVFTNSSEDHQSPVATVEITKVLIKTSSLKLVSGSTSSIKDYSSAAALLIKTAKHYLKVYVDQKDLALRVKALNACALTDTLADAHVALSIDNGPNSKQLRFVVKDYDLLGKGVTFKPRFIDDTDEDLHHTLKGLSHYYHHLKRTSDTLKKSIDKISVSFYEVQDTMRGHPRVVKMDGAEDLCKNNVIDIAVPPSKPDHQGQIYGFEVTNNTDGGILYPVLFYFDNINFTISEL